jgi:hypothetical protein
MDQHATSVAIAVVATIAIGAAEGLRATRKKAAKAGTSKK